MKEEKGNDIIKEAEEVAEIGERKFQLEELAVELSRTAPGGEIITREQVEAAKRNMERIAKMVKSPEGKYKVIGIDKFFGKDWI